MKDTTILFRVDSELKEKATQIAKESKLDLSKLLTGYLIDTVKRGKVSINIINSIGHCFDNSNSLTIHIIKKKLSEILDCKIYKDKINKIILFGSYARGEANEDSNLDFRIDCTENMSGFDLGNLYMDLKDAFNVDIDLLTALDSDLPESFLENIKNEGIILFERK